MWPGFGHMAWMWFGWFVGPVVLFLVPPRDGESPETILKRRYARGEIDRDEYQSRLRDLRQ